MDASTLYVVMIEGKFGGGTRVVFSSLDKAAEYAKLLCALSDLSVSILELSRR